MIRLIFKLFASTSRVEVKYLSLTMLLRISLILNIAFFCVGVFLLYNYRDRVMLYLRPLDKENVHVILVGDSKTAYGDWSRRLNRFDVKNMGVPSYTSFNINWHVRGLLEEYHPKIVFIEGGVNDFYFGYPVQDTYLHLTNIYDTLQKHQIKVVVQATLLTRIDEGMNDSIVSLNKKLREYCQIHQLEFLDVNPYLTENGKLKEEYTKDGIHLTDAAYKVWAKAIHSSLTKNKI